MASSSSSPNYGSITQTPSSSFSPTELLTKRVSIRETIHTNLITIKKNTVKLEKIQKAIGSRSDNHDLRKKMHEIQKSCNELIKQTSGNIGSIIQMSSDASQKIQSEKLFSEFNLIVQKYLSVEKSLASKLKKTVLVNVDDDESPEPENQRFTQQIRQEALQYEHEQLLERERNINRIETDVVDINKMMNEISSLIHEQGQSIDTIETHVDAVQTDVEQGQEELRKASNYQQGRRKIVLIILIILIIIALIVAFSIYRKA